MTTPKAIVTLRERMNLTQEKIADKLGVTITSISRYENGREPNRSVLAKLEKLAADAKIEDLRAVFAARWTAGITTRLQKLQSEGTERPVSLSDLKRWQAMPIVASEQLQQAKATCMNIMARVDEQDRQRLGAVNRLLSAVAENILMDLSRQIQTYINIPTTKGTKPIRHV